jgi:hypothetical protein
MDSREPAVSIDEVGVGHNRDIFGDALTRHKNPCPVGILGRHIQHGEEYEVACLILKRGAEATE